MYMCIYIYVYIDIYSIYVFVFLYMHMDVKEDTIITPCQALKPGELTPGPPESSVTRTPPGLLLRNLS